MNKINPLYKGLTQSQAKEKLAQFGFNELKDANKTSAFKILVRQISGNYIIYLLIVIFLISLMLGEGPEAYIILAVILLVISTGFIQEYKAEQAINTLRKMQFPTTIVLRDGKEQEINSREIVPEDIVIIGEGERVPADCLVIENNELRVDESVLTGESKEVKKQVPPSEEAYADENVIFMGTFIISGRCKAKVLHTGMNTSFGKIARMITTTEKELPLQTKVNSISKTMVVIALVTSVFTGVIILLRAETITTQVVFDTLILVVALCVSSFPEGFPVVLTTTLAVGVGRMAKQNAIVNRMSIIETLGETTVICTDKTGTITKGEMTVKKLFLDGDFIDVGGSGYEGQGDFVKHGHVLDIQNHPVLMSLIETSILCNNARIERTAEDENYAVFGSQTEAALLIMGAKAGLFKEDMGFERLKETPFTSERKMFSVLVGKNDEKLVCTIGSPWVILEKCESVKTSYGIGKLTHLQKNHIYTAAQEMASESLRVLAIGYKELNNKSHTSGESEEYTEDKFIYLGLVGMEDPPREETAEALEHAKHAGIRVKMITGDGENTAIAIGKQVGLAGNVLLGEQIDELTDDELVNVASETIIFARVRPEHKLRIVRALKQKGEIVTMTGDGVNDAPALKEAHIGVAMGKSGTDVTRSVADLTLKDDNFATIITAIKEGRTIFNNIQKFVSYELSCNIAEITIILIGTIISPYVGWKIPILLALQVLFMNLVTDDLPAITLGVNQSSKDILKEKPRKKPQILNSSLLGIMLFNGLLMAIMTLGALYILFNVQGQNFELARSIALVLLITVEIAAAYNFRSFRHKALSLKRLFVNKYLIYASCISLAATLIVVYSPLNHMFEVIPIPFIYWLVAIAFSFLILLIFDILKMISLRRGASLIEIT